MKQFGLLQRLLRGAHLFAEYLSSYRARAVSISVHMGYDCLDALMFEHDSGMTGARV